MLLIVGIGNPGTQYKNTRHNAGFLAVDYLADYYSIPLSLKKNFNAEIGHGVINGDKVLLAKPLTYMNLSGSAVQALFSYYKIAPSNLCVVHDEIDLPLGKVKLKFGGSSAGHNGLKSIDSCLGNNYYRIRIGIGRPDKSDLIEVSDYVLGNFTSEEQAVITSSIKHIPHEIEAVLKTPLI